MSKDKKAAYLLNAALNRVKKHRYITQDSDTRAAICESFVNYWHGVVSGTGATQETAANGINTIRSFFKSIDPESAPDSEFSQAVENDKWELYKLVAVKFALGRFDPI